MLPIFRFLSKQKDGIKNSKDNIVNKYWKY